MTIEVQGPDGAIHEFPDKTPLAVMKGAMIKKYGSSPGAQGGGNSFGQFGAPSEGRTIQTPYGPRKALVIGGKPVETPNTVGALGRSIANTATFGLADRIAAAGESLTGLGGDFGDYSGNLAREQAQTEAANAEHPFASIAGTLGGAILALFGGAAKGAATLGERVLAGGGAGALQGALYGAGSSKDLTDIPDVAEKAITGAGLGGALGAGLPAVTEGAGRLIRAAANKTGIPQAITGYLNPEAAAARIVGNALQRDREIGAAGLTPQEFGSALDRGQPVVTADIGGKTTQRLADTAATISPEAQHILERTANQRFEGQATRIADQLTRLGGGNSVQTLDKLKDAAEKANRPLYQKFYDQTARGVWSPELAQLSEAPAVQAAIKDASRTGMNRDIARGFKPTKNPFIEMPDGSMALKANPDGSTPIPSGQFCDHVKRNLDAKIESLLGRGERSEASDLISLKKQIVSEVDEASNGAYADARGTAAKAFGAEPALEAGAKFFDAKGQNHQFAKVIAKMSGPEKELFAHGLMARIENKVRELGDKRDAVNALFDSPASRERIEMAIGRDRARQLETYLHVERVMDNLRQFVGGGSQTYRRFSDVGAPALVGGATYIGSGGDTKDATIAGMAAALLKHGAKGINQGVMQKVGEMLASSDPAVYQRAVNTVQNNKQLSSLFKTITPAAVTAILSGEAQSPKNAQTQEPRLLNIHPPRSQ